VLTRSGIRTPWAIRRCDGRKKYQKLTSAGAAKGQKSRRSRFRSARTLHAGRSPPAGGMGATNQFDRLPVHCGLGRTCEATAKTRKGLDLGPKNFKQLLRGPSAFPMWLVDGARSAGTRAITARRIFHTCMPNFRRQTTISFSSAFDLGSPMHGRSAPAAPDERPLKNCWGKRCPGGTGQLIR